MNHTDFETSKRLAEVWPLGAADRRHLRWLRRPSDDEGPAGEWCLTEGREASNYLAWGYESIPARTLSELEAKIREMGLYLELTRWCGGETVANLWKANELAIDPSATGAHGKTDTIINALGAAVAEALEAGAKENPQTGGKAVGRVLDGRTHDATPETG